MSAERPINQMVNLKWFKESGKFAYSGRAVVNHFLFEDGFKQDIVNTQDSIRDGWQDHSDMYLVVTAPEEVNGFFEVLYTPGRFAGIKKEVKE